MNSLAQITNIFSIISQIKLQTVRLYDCAYIIFQLPYLHSFRSTWYRSSYEIDKMKECHCWWSTFFYTLKWFIKCRGWLLTMAKKRRKFVSKLFISLSLSCAMFLLGHVSMMILKVYLTNNFVQNSSQGSTDYILSSSLFSFSILINFTLFFLHLLQCSFLETPWS